MPSSSRRSRSLKKRETAEASYGRPYRRPENRQLTICDNMVILYGSYVLHFIPAICSILVFVCRFTGRSRVTDVAIPSRIHTLHRILDATSIHAVLCAACVMHSSAYCRSTARFTLPLRSFAERSATWMRCPIPRKHENLEIAPNSLVGLIPVIGHTCL